MEIKASLSEIGTRSYYAFQRILPFCDYKSPDKVIHGSRTLLTPDGKLIFEPSFRQYLDMELNPDCIQEGLILSVFPRGKLNFSAVLRSTLPAYLHLLEKLQDNTFPGVEVIGGSTGPKLARLAVQKLGFRYMNTVISPGQKIEVFAEKSAVLAKYDELRDLLKRLN